MPYNLPFTSPFPYQIDYDQREIWKETQDFDLEEDIPAEYRQAAQELSE